MLARRPGRRAYALAAALLAVTATACGGSSGRTANSGASSAAPVTAPCPGTPLRFTTILSLSGPLSFGSVGTEVANGNKAALQAVNGECALGRPIDIVVCDDKSDPNQAAECGREAKSNGSLALFGSSGTFDTGTTAAGLPGILTGGGTLFDLTNAQSFSATSGLTLVVGGVSAAAAANAKSMVFVAFDTAAARAFVGISQKIADGLGVHLDTVWVPPDTTDFAPVAAQVAEKKPEAIGLILSSIVPLMNAFDAEGISAQHVPIMTAVTLFPPEVTSQLGSKADGVYLLTQQAPPSEADNPGIQQLRTELKSAGVNNDPSSLSPATTVAWSNVHILADILKKLPPSQVATLDAAGLVAAMQQAGPISRPEAAPFDFSKNAYPDIEALAGFRLFSREAMVVRIKNGTYVSVSPFGDATKPFHLEN